LDIFKPQYNILKNAYSLLGYKHSAESRAKMSAHAKNRSEETLAKMSLSLPHAKKIEVTDVTTNISTSYDSMGAAARALNISKSCISRYFSRNGIKKNLIKEDMFLNFFNLRQSNNFPRLCRKIKGNQVFIGE
jgi:hypothetical protein